MNSTDNLSVELTIRSCQEDDFPRLIEIWEATGISLGVSDTPLELERFLQMNPQTFLVGTLNNEIVGVVMGGYDGRRGIVHHLAVAPEFQGHGYARLLLEELERNFQRMNVVKYHGWIEARNSEVLSFYKHMGYEERDFTTVTRTLRS